MIIGLDELVSFYTDKLISLGLDEARSRTLSLAQVEVHAFGTDTHGLPPLHNMIRELAKNPDMTATPRIIHEFGALLTADSSLTPPVEPILWGAEKAAGLAGVHGIGFVSLTDGGWVGTMGYHLARWARKGYIMMGWNQTSSLPVVNPFGGRDARFNTNPMAFSFPVGQDDEGRGPLVADFSTAAISRGRTFKMAREGEKAREKYYLDRDGRSSDDPNHHKRGGPILPFGGEVSGFRGTALAFLIEAMTAAAGAVPVNKERTGGQNVHVLALNIDAMGGLEGYGELMGSLTGWVLASKPIPGGAGVRYPGQRGWTALEKARGSGTEVGGELLAQLEEMGFSGD